MPFSPKRGTRARRPAGIQSSIQLAEHGQALPGFDRKPGRPAASVSGALREVDVDDARWAQFVNSQPTATPFHYPHWARLVADCYGYRSSALLLDDGQGQIVAGLPLVRVRRPLLGERGVSLPFTDNCPPLAR